MQVNPNTSELSSATVWYFFHYYNDWRLKLVTYHIRDKTKNEAPSYTLPSIRDPWKWYKTGTCFESLHIISIQQIRSTAKKEDEAPHFAYSYTDNVLSLFRNSIFRSTFQVIRNYQPSGLIQQTVRTIEAFIGYLAYKNCCSVLCSAHVALLQGVHWSA